MDFGPLLVSIADSIETASVTERAKSIASPPIPKSFSSTQRMIAKMMRENTGASILDSGGAYGRAWQSNLKSDFRNRPRATLSASIYDDKVSFDLSIDLFHYLTDRLDYDPGMTRKFQQFAKLAENRDEPWLTIMEKFPRWISMKKKETGFENYCYSGNSYNEDNFLSGTVQYTCFSMLGEEYVILQIHGGCDVRGGYTKPRIFTVSNGGFCDWNGGEIVPDWDEIRNLRQAAHKHLESVQFLFADDAAAQRYDADNLGTDVWWNVGGYDDHGEKCRKLGDYPGKEIQDRKDWEKGTICVLPDGRALCPETGCVLLGSFC